MIEKARDVMQIGVKTVAHDASIYEAIRILVERRISGLPVMNGPDLVGIITEKDILRLVFHEERLPGPVQAYMTPRVVAFDEEEPLDTIWSCLVHNTYRRVAILRNGRLTGIITRTDLIRARASDFRSPSPVAAEPRDSGPLVRDVMTAGLLMTTANAPVGEAVQTLLTHEITGLPVVDDGMHLTGILSEKDVLGLLDGGLDGPGRNLAKAWRVGEIMTRDVTSFDMNDSLLDVCECLANNSFRRVPVLDGGRLAGVVSRADLVLYILKNRSMLFRGRPVAAETQNLASLHLS